MWRTTICGAALVVIGLAATAALGQDRAMTTLADERAAMVRASEGLSGYVAHALTEANVRNFGFESLAEARAARLGEPARVLEIGLDDVQAYAPGVAVAAIARDPGILWFPVLVDARTAAKLLLVEQDGRWHPGPFGDASGAQRLAAIRTDVVALARNAGLPQPTDVVLVEVPALAATFWYARDGQREVLIPAMALPERFALVNGRAYPASEALERVADVAREIDPRTLR